ncbi:MAG: glycosyl amidation-associated protein WbuZ [Desulfobulbaceae bacterium]|nr:glycosyl amidation-associated protein WbuZ [Desulfobulbaceae bacterium]HIJ90244.1 imidazole glycerol phosphate synthase subunit HisF [Deltaproteobacteria bacterium]
MLKVRIMPTLLYRDFELVKGVGFDSWRGVGSAMQAIRVYNMREVDELIFLDITATREERDPDFELIDDLADECFMPLTVGGGVRSLDDVRRLLDVGADKVAINSEAVRNPELIREVAQRFGSQCVVVSIDVRKQASGRYEIFTHSGHRATGVDPVVFVKEAARLGAGEILLTSIERDGAMEGYDLVLIQQVSEAVDIPVIASGGAGIYEDLYKALTIGNAAAVAAASIFHFTEQTPLAAKDYLYSKGIPVRF